MNDDMRNELVKLESENAELRQKLARFQNLPNGIPTTEPGGLISPWIANLAEANAEIARLRLALLNATEERDRLRVQLGDVVLRLLQYEDGTVSAELRALSKGEKP